MICIHADTVVINNYDTDASCSCSEDNSEEDDSDSEPESEKNTKPRKHGLKTLSK